MFLYFDNRVKSTRVKIGPQATDISFGLIIVIVSPLLNWLQYQLFLLPHKMFGIFSTTIEKNDCSTLNGLIIFDAHSTTSDGKSYPFGWRFILAKVIGYTLYVLPICGICISLVVTSLENDATKSFIAPLQMNAFSLALVFVGISFAFIILSLLEQIEHPGKWHSPAKQIITILFSLSIMTVPWLCSNISNMKLICLMNSNQAACANVRSEITCNSPSYDNNALKYTTEGNEVVRNYFLDSTGTCYFNFLFVINIFFFYIKRLCLSQFVLLIEIMLQEIFLIKFDALSTFQWAKCI